MATDNHHLNDALRNPAVDYERADLSAKGILLFLIGLALCCVFIEIVIWGMFHFLRNSEGIFAKGQTSPLATVQSVPPESLIGAKMQNAPPADVTATFPEPRLQTHDWEAMNDFLESEHKILYPAQPFTDTRGTIHIPITDAMKLVEQRLQVRTNAPPRNFDAAESTTTGMKSETGGEPEKQN